MLLYSERKSNFRISAIVEVPYYYTPFSMYMSTMISLY